MELQIDRVYEVPIIKVVRAMACQLLLTSSKLVLTIGSEIDGGVMTDNDVCSASTRSKTEAIVLSSVRRKRNTKFSGGTDDGDTALHPYLPPRFPSDGLARPQTRAPCTTLRPISREADCVNICGSFS